MLAWWTVALACVLTAPVSTLVWRLRRYLSAGQLKQVLSSLLILPVLAALIALSSPVMSSCASHATCYLGVIERFIGSQFFPFLRVFALLGAVMTGYVAIELGYNVLIAARTMRRLYACSRPPSKKLQRALEQVVPVKGRSRFRQVTMSGELDGVYGGVCLISDESVHNLSPAQLTAIVAHEWQHLRAGDGWFALLAAVVASSIGGTAWRAVYRHWRNAAELLADDRAVRCGVSRILLARTLLHRQATAHNLALGFTTEGVLLEERLRQLISSELPPARVSGWGVWSLVLLLGWLLFYVVWSTDSASTCTLHCVLF